MPVTWPQVVTEIVSRVVPGGCRRGISPVGVELTVNQAISVKMAPTAAVTKKSHSADAK